MNLTFPDGITKEDFLRDYWQKKPLYLPAAINHFTDPLEPEELAGLACEEEIAARIILDKGNDDWQIMHNPFTEDDFTNLPATHWTVLVQDLNKHIRELDLLLESFSFLPSWRIDDVMVSYAAPYGGVGPHTDQYDVFLLQGMGSRRWQISKTKDNDKLIEGIDLRILENFESEQQFVLQPGDMLYLPPGFQHFGVSEEPCMTYSIGFRAPTQLELLGDYIDQLTLKQTNHDDLRYHDPSLSDTPSGEITADAIKNIVTLIKTIPDGEIEIKDWFGKFITSTHQTLTNIPVESDVDATTLVNRIQQGEPLYRNPASRFAYIKNKENTIFYIDGCSLSLTGATAGIAKYICSHRQFNANDLADWLANTQCLSLLSAWVDIGLLEFSDDEASNGN